MRKKAENGSNARLRLTCGIPWNREAERAIQTLGRLAHELCAEE